MNVIYKNKLYSDIERVLALPRNNGYEKAIRPVVMERFMKFLKGELKSFKKSELWNALTEIGKLYGMVINYNPYTKLASFHIQKAPCICRPQKIGFTTYYGKFHAKDAENNFFRCIVETLKVFTSKYKGVPIYQEAIIFVKSKTGLK